MRKCAISLVAAVLGLNVMAGGAPVQAQDIYLPAGEAALPTPGQTIPLSQAFHPPILKGLKIHPENPFRFDFILDPGRPEGTEGPLKEQPKAGSSVKDSSASPQNDMGRSIKDPSASRPQDDYMRLIKYFLASLTVPEKDLWVNLSPYEKDRIVPDAFGQTEMGRDLLAQDYLLKQLTASLIYPDGETGKKFWSKVYAEAAKRYGNTNVPVNTFNKVWIMPDKAVVYENAKAGTAYVVESKLKVMLEEDYLAATKNRRQPGDMFKTEQPRTCPQAGCQATKGSHVKAPQGTNGPRSEPTAQDDSEIASQILRDLVIPQLTKEVNEGKNFAQLRQVYNSLILANWYKKKIKDSILAKIYADKNKIEGLLPTRGHVQDRTTKNVSPSGLPSNNGLNVKATEGTDPLDVDPLDVDAIYHRYLEAFKKGAYNYIKEEIDPATQKPVARKYFSGGMIFGRIDSAMVITGKWSIIDSMRRALRIQVRVDPTHQSPQIKRIPPGLNPSLAEYLSLRAAPHVPLGEGELQASMEHISQLRADFLPWVLKQMNDLQAQQRPLRVRIIYTYHGGGGQAGKVALLVRGLLAVHPNMDIRIEQMSATMGPSYSFGIEYLPNVKIGSYLGFSHFDPDVTIGINTQRAKGINPDFSLNVLALNNGRSAAGRAVNDDDLASPIGTVVLDPGLREMRRASNAIDSVEKRAKMRQQWLDAHLSGQARSHLEEAEWGIWTFAHSHRLKREIILIRKALSASTSLSRYYLEDGVHDRKAAQVVIFSSQGLNDIDEIRDLGATVINGGMVLPPHTTQSLPVTVVMNDFHNEDVRELISWHTGTMLRSKNNTFWIDFPLFITGNASWMEAISAGALWRHDNIDAAESKISDIKMMMFRYLGADALNRAPDFPKIFLSSSDENFYDNLEAWTAWGMAFSEKMHRGYNRIVDILGFGVAHALASQAIEDRYGYNIPISWRKALLGESGHAGGHIVALHFPYNKEDNTTAERPSADQAVVSDLGGIDLSDDKAFAIQGGGRQGIHFHLDEAQVRQLQSAPGLQPVIMNIQPMSNIQGFLEMNDGA